MTSLPISNPQGGPHRERTVNIMTINLHPQSTEHEQAASRSTARTPDADRRITTVALSAVVVAVVLAGSFLGYKIIQWKSSVQVTPTPSAVMAAPSTAAGAPLPASEKATGHILPKPSDLPQGPR
jgi:hypothetical protein